MNYDCLYCNKNKKQKALVIKAFSFLWNQLKNFLADVVNNAKNEKILYMLF